MWKFIVLKDFPAVAESACVREFHFALTLLRPKISSPLSHTQHFTNTKIKALTHSNLSRTNTLTFWAYIILDFYFWLRILKKKISRKNNEKHGKSRWKKWSQKKTKDKACMQRTYRLAIIIDQRRGSFPSSMLNVFFSVFIFFSSVWPQYRKINAQSLIPRRFPSLVHPNQGRP